MNSTRTLLETRCRQAIAAAYDLNDMDPLLIPASSPQFGDYQFNVPLHLARTLKATPRAIAERIVAHLDLADLCDPPTIGGPGFINVTLKRDYVASLLNAVYADPRLGLKRVETPGRVVIDFSSPNIAKEMHVGHLRSTILGDCIARILDFLGHDVLRLNHVGDWGTQFGMLIAFLREEAPEMLTGAETVDMEDLVWLYRRSKQRFDEDEAFKERARREVVRLQAGAEDSLQAWRLLCEQSRHAFQQIYDLLEVPLVERGESFYNPLLPDVVTSLEARGLLQESAGSQCVFVEGFTSKTGDALPLIIRKRDGGYNYATTDLAALRYRVEQDRADWLIYVTDLGQADHFTQIFAVARLAGWLSPGISVVHMPFGLVLGENGKRLRTRSGDTVRLMDLLEEAVLRAREALETRLAADGREETEAFKAQVARTVGIAAVKYADLSQHRLSNYIFRFDQMLALQGNTAPYMLYAYARIQGIYRKGSAQAKAGLPVSVGISLRHDAETVLAKHLLHLDTTLQDVLAEYLPHRLCQYLFELSQKFNQFYEQCPVLVAEPELRGSRLALCDLTARTIRLGLSLLGIHVLDRL